MLVVNKPDNFKPHNSLKLSFVNNSELWNFLLNTVLQQQGFIQTQLTSVYWRSKLNLKASFETQSFKPKNKKVIKHV